MDLKSRIRDIPDFPEPGILFRDITPLLADPEALQAAVDRLARPFAAHGAQKILGIESRGFMFGAPLAIAMDIGFVPVRKAGKLPSETLAETYDLEYGQATLEIHRDALEPGERVVIVDDVLATGGTLAAAVRLARGLGAEVVGAGILVELLALQGRRKVPDVDVESVVQY